jgi:hypothetical protein
MTKEEKREYNRKWYAKNPHYVRNWLALRPGYNQAACKKWREAHPEKSKEFTRAWRARNKEKYLAHTKAQKSIKRMPCEVCGELGQRHHPDRPTVRSTSSVH